MTEHAGFLTRREFVKILGPGLYILVSAQDFLSGQAPKGFGRGYPEDFNAYLRIAEDGRVTCYSGKVELGQGITASLAQMLAEELEVPYESVSMVLGDTKLCPWDPGTNGSRSIKYFGPALRAAAAEAREVLIQLASEHLRVPAERLIAENGFVFQRDNPGNKVDYGSLAKGKTIERHLETKPPLKAASAFQVCGKSLPRADFQDKVTGKAQFAGDIRLPEMLYGKVFRPPAHGAKLKRVDVSAVKRIKGARVLQEKDFVGVVHPLPDVAEKAIALIKADYELPEATINDGNIHEYIIKTPARDSVVEEKGDLKEGRSRAVVTFEETYRTPYVAHAPTETHTAVVHVEGDTATAWIGTQRPFGADAEIARAIGISDDRVRVITPFVGGGFGGKSQVGQAVQAARLSKLSGHPVQVTWSREEEFFYDTFQPAAVVRISSGLDKSNRIAFWDYHVFFAGDRSSQNIYDVPNVRTTSRGSGFGGGGPHPFPTGAWRGPGSNTNIFSRESHIDIMAAKAEMDPLEFRCLNLADQRMLRVIDAAAARFGWKPAKGPSGQGRAMVCLDYLGTYVAAMAGIRVDKDSRIKVERVVCAVDMGPVINPEGARLQIEGSVIMGLGYCLTEEMHFRGGAVQDIDFGSYSIPRFSWVPEIEPVLVENLESAPSGCGEPPIVGMGALLANALFDATGARVTQLPLTPARIRQAKA
ncbi:MAG: xanthine dehydrogenase family protein molybdopterin-binding subunit [Acidobacteria bacterium]|nr:xanthine dehydrogenase family protein molybdopterin-binding subunit [Acidobacteriota bacterium]